MPEILDLLRGFQSTPPSRGATALREDFGELEGFQSTPPSRGATGGT